MQKCLNSGLPVNDYCDGDGFVLLYKRVENSSFQCPNGDEVRELTSQQLRCLTEGLKIDQPKAYKLLSEFTSV